MRYRGDFLDADNIDPVARLLSSACKGKNPRFVQAWLRYWIFSDDGAALIPRRGDSTAESLSLEERQKIATLFAAKRRKWPENLPLNGQASFFL